MTDAETFLLARHFLEDWRALEKLAFSASGVNASDIRMLCAPLLRKWLVERDFLRIQKQIGERVTFPVNDLRPEIRACERGDISVLAAVESFVDDIPVGHFCYSPPGRQPNLPDTQTAAAVNLPLQDFGRQKILFWKSTFATRCDIIKYVCNKWGGIHFDMKLDDQVYAAIDEARYLFGFKRDAGQLSMRVNFNGSLEIQERNFDDDFIDVALLGILNTSQSFCRGTTRYLPHIARLTE